jgi:hypothetical protein
MPTSTTNGVSAVAKALAQTYVWRIDGKPFEINFSHLDGVEIRDAKNAAGLTQQQLVTNAWFGEFDALAAVIWVLRRRDEPTLSYEDVLKGLRFDNVEFVFGPDGKPAEEAEDADPPA